MPTRTAEIEMVGGADCWRGCRTVDSHTLLMGMSEATVSLENSLVVPYEGKYVLRR